MADLRDWITNVESMEWSALLLDDDWRVVWVSPRLMEQLGETDETALRSAPTWWMRSSARRGSAPSIPTARPTCSSGSVPTS